MYKKRFIMLTALGLGACFWLVDGLLDYYIFYQDQGTLFQVLFTRIPGHEFYMRGLIAVFFLVFGLVMCIMSDRLRKALGKARENEKWLYTTMRSIGDGVIATDARERVTFLNRAAEKYTGWNLEEAKGMPLAQVFHIINAKTRERQINPVAKVLRTGKVVGLANHTVLISKDGREFQIADSAAGIFDSEKKVSGVVLAFRDVTSEYQTREKLLQSEKKFRILFDSNPTGLILVDSATLKFMQTNQSFRDIVGFSEEELGRLTVGDITHPDDWLEEFVKIQHQFEQGEGYPFSMVKRYLRKDGHTRWARVHGVLHSNGDRPPVAIASVEDITERKMALDALQESEEWVRILFEQAVDAIYVSDEAGALLEINNAACRATGYTKSELLNLGFFDVDAETDSSEDFKYFMDAAGTKLPVTIQSRHRRKDGSTYPVEITVGDFQTSDGRLYMCIARDISQRLARELTYAEILKIAHDGFWLLDTEGRLLECNPAAANMLGYGMHEMPGKSLGDLEAAERPEEIFSHIKQVRDKGSARFETRHRRKDGSIIEVEVSASFLPLNQGCFITFVRDISHRRKAEQALIENEERLRAILENLADGVFAHDLDGNITMVNRAACRNTGYSHRELLNMTVADLDRATASRKDRERLWLKMIRGKGVKIESTHRRKDGSEYPTEIRLRAISLQGKPLILGLAQDISGRKAVEKEKAALESQLRQAQKMEAVGTLAGGIAHDFNNILSAITGYSELALDAARDGNTAPEELGQVLKAANRAKILVQQILAFSRKSPLEAKPLNINSVIADSVRLLERTLPKMIDLTVCPASGLKLINGDPNQIEQVILNLANNAQAAMPEGGRLVLETENIHLGREFTAAHLGSTPGEYVRLVISDTGTGIDPQIMEHIFEPFFTTKGAGKGTGLGLASTYGIVKSHKGYITCQSQKGDGTTFNIYFPALGEVKSGGCRETGWEKKIPGGKETVLLVDDEDSLRTVAGRFLENAGYQVIRASSGEEALEAYGREGPGIDLVIMDLSMPGMGGRKAIQEIRVLNPGAKIIIASGYASGGPNGKEQPDGVKEYIAKPFRRNELLLAVRKVLDSVC